MDYKKQKTKQNKTKTKTKQNKKPIIDMYMYYIP